jgi:hypothetical protein
MRVKTITKQMTMNDFIRFVKKLESEKQIDLNDKLDYLKQTGGDNEK